MMQVIIGLAFVALDVMHEKNQVTTYYTSVELQDSDRPPIPEADLILLRDRNIFSPWKVHMPPPRPPNDREMLTPKPPVVTGIFLDMGSGAYQVVVEDRNKAHLKLLMEPRFLKATDHILIYTIESVDAEKVVVCFGKTKKELKVGETLPDAGLTIPEDK